MGERTKYIIIFQEHDDEKTTIKNIKLWSYHNQNKYSVSNIMEAFNIVQHIGSFGPYMLNILREECYS